MTALSPHSVRTSGVKHRRAREEETAESESWKMLWMGVGHWLGRQCGEEGLPFGSCVGGCSRLNFNLRSQWALGKYHLL